MLLFGMVDFNEIKKNPQAFRDVVKNKNSSINIDELLELGEQKSTTLTALNSLRADANRVTEEIRNVNGKPENALLNKAKELKEAVKKVEAEFREIDERFSKLMLNVPNMPSSDTPVGPSEDDNVVLREWGKGRDFKAEGFSPLEHWELGEKLGLIDTARAAKVSGSRFAYLMGDLVKLQFALIQFAIENLTNSDFLQSIITEHGFKGITNRPFQLVIPPVIINPIPFERMARIEPREERYHITEDDQYLIGSAEHTLGAIHMDETLKEEDMPIRYLGYSTSFRREAGTYGKDMKGILRLHQFDKVEAEVFSTAEASQTEQDFLVAIQEKLMQMLNIPYRVIICSTGDQGDPDSRHLDIESWLPGQGRYRETHSADLMTDYQTRRMNTKVLRKNGEKELAHTNDATVFAIGRTLIAIMENYQQKDGSIIVPDVLQKYANIKEIK